MVQRTVESGSDKNTLLLDYTNHYNKGMTKCFIQVEWHKTNGGEAPGRTV